MLETEIIVGEQALSQLRSSWERLFRSSFNEPSTSFEWTRALVHQRVDLWDKLLVLLVRAGEGVIAVIPLVPMPDTLLGIPYTTLIPLSEIYRTHSDFLAVRKDTRVVDAVLSTLRSRRMGWEIFRLGRMIEGGPLATAFEEALMRNGLQYRIRREYPSYYLNLNLSFSQYLAERSGKFRNHLRRRERKLKAEGKVTVRWLNEFRSFDEAYDALLVVERKSWKWAAKTSIADAKDGKSFFYSMGIEAHRCERLHLVFLYLRGQPIAYNAGYLHNGGYYYLRTSYDAAHKALGPATVLRARLIEGLIVQGVEWMDFPGQPFEWERQWTSCARWNQSVTIFNRTTRGVLLASGAAIRTKLRGSADRESFRHYRREDFIHKN